MRQIVAGGAPPSIAAAVTVEGRIVWEAACGLANREDRVPATPGTLSYTLASWLRLVREVPGRKAR